MGSFSLKVQLHLHEFDSHKDHRLAASGDMEITHQWRWGFMRRKKKRYGVKKETTMHPSAVEIIGQVTVTSKQIESWGIR
jgi:hypothetical protein